MATQTKQQNKSKTDEVSPLSEAEFSDGDLGRIQGILFGDQARKTTERIDALELSLLGAINEMQNSFTSQVEALWARVEEESDTRNNAVTKLGERLNTETADRGKSDAAFRSDLASTTAQLNDAITKASSVSADKLQQTRQALSAQFEAETAELRNKGLTRESLATIFSSSVQQLRSEES